MNELIFLQNNQAITTSLIVAERFDKRHDLVVRDIRTIIGQMASVSQSSKMRDGVNTPMFMETTYQAEEGGRKYPMYEMNRDGFSLLAMGFTGQKALEFKLKFIAAFNAMEAALAERKSAEWQEIREGTKRGYKILSASTQKLHQYAVSQGCTVEETLFYVNFARLINKTLGIKSGSRDKLAAWQLYEVEKLQFIAQTIINGLIAGKADYHQPYKNCKTAFDSYARLSYIGERLSLAQAS